MLAFHFKFRSDILRHTLTFIDYSPVSKKKMLSNYIIPFKLHKFISYDKNLKNFSILILMYQSPNYKNAGI